MISVVASLEEAPLADASIPRAVGRSPETVAIAVAVPVVVIDAGPVRQEDEAEKPEQNAGDLQTQDCPTVVQGWLPREGDEVVGKNKKTGGSLCGRQPAISGSHLLG